MAEEFRIITETQFDRAVAECIDHMRCVKGFDENNAIISACMTVVQLFALDLERTLFKEEATVNG